MNDKDYSALPGIRRSDLWKMNRSPLHFRYFMDNPEEQTPALVFGSAAHAAILEGWEAFEKDFATCPNMDRRTKEGKQKYFEFLESAGSKQLISPEDFAKISSMREVFWNDPRVKSLLGRPYKTEIPFQWIDGKTGEPVKCKADIITTDENGMPVVIDYKTTMAADYRSFRSSARKFGYDFQVGFYTEGINLSTLEKHGFIFIVQEKEPPFAVAIYECDESLLIQGRRKFHKLLTEYHECRMKDEWPGYETEMLYGEEL